MIKAWRNWKGRLRAFATRFARSRNGAVAMYFALAAVPLFALSGAALDYSRVISTRTRLQAALDATALALSKKAALETAAQLQSDATTLFNSEFQSAGAKNASVTATYSTTGGFSVTVSGSAQVTGYFSPAIGVQTFNVSSSSTVTWGGARLRVALVLDTTGSMADNGKIDALKTATTNLLTQLQSSATTAADVYVSIIPFTRDVNIGSSNYTQSYIDWTDWNANNGTCSGGGGGGGGGRSDCTAGAGSSIIGEGASRLRPARAGRERKPWRRSRSRPSPTPTSAASGCSCAWTSMCPRTRMATSRTTRGWWRPCPRSGTCWSGGRAWC